jgi:ABC-2 type transport system permease protein
VSGFVAGFLAQLAEARHRYGDFMPVITAPLYVILFVAITRHAGREDLTSFAVLAPALIVLWATAVFISGQIIEHERWAGTLEALVATPAGMSWVIFGRISAVTLIGLLGFVESWLAAWLVFGIWIPIPHTLVFGAALVATALAMAGTATVISAVAVMLREPGTFRNSLSYPFYVLGGVLVPVALLPDWLQPFSRIVFLSWSSDLLRDALQPAAVTAPGARLAAIVGLGVAWFLVGQWVLGRVLRRVRHLGTVSYA